MLYGSECFDHCPENARSPLEERMRGVELDRLAGVHDYHAVGVDDCVQSMRDRQYCTIGEFLPNRLLDQNVSAGKQEQIKQCNGFPSSSTHCGSTFAVASSSTSIRFRLKMALARQSSWRWPTLKLLPRAITVVWSANGPDAMSFSSTFSKALQISSSLYSSNGSRLLEKRVISTPEDAI